MPAKRYLAFSFLCTFIPGSEKSIERTFAPVEQRLTFFYKVINGEVVVTTDDLGLEVADVRTRY